MTVTSSSYATQPGNLELRKAWSAKVSGHGFSLCAVPTFYCSPVIWSPEKIRQICGKLFPEGRRVQKGSGKFYESYEWVQEFESFSKRQDMPGSISGCQKFWKVLKNKGKPPNNTGRQPERLRSFRRAEGSEAMKAQESHEEELCQVGDARHS